MHTRTVSRFTATQTPSITLDYRQLGGLFVRNRHCILAFRVGVPTSGQLTSDIQNDPFDRVRGEADIGFL
jgi:hypothetical protein